ncbi:MAG TPA: antitermination protein NusB, partial [Vicingus sp.]|nr:antitermination protein NusB [Vicingus sp.]
MISRRYLRVKTFQALYAYFQSEDQNMKKAENELFLSLERMYDLYLFFLALGRELTHQSELKMEEAKNKRLPSA